MKRIIITESQAKILGLIKINENAGDESGMKSSGNALGPKPIRIVISGDSVPKLKDIIIKAIKRQDPDTSIAYYEATGKIVGNVSEYKIEAVKREVKFIDPMISLEKKSLNKSLKENKKSVLKITKEQYNKLISVGLIKEMKETPDMMKETKNFIEYMYGITKNYPSFLNESNLTYEEICEILLNEGIIVENDGYLKLSKSMGTPDMAIREVMKKLNEMINSEKMLKMEEEEYFSEPILPKSSEFDVLYHNKEIAILRDKNGEYYVFGYGEIPKKEFLFYADDVRKTFVGYDEEGEPQFDYGPDINIDNNTIERFLNDNLNSFSYGSGLSDFEKGVDIVKIDDAVKEDIIRLYDKDQNLIKMLSSLTETKNIQPRTGQFREPIDTGRQGEKRLTTKGFGDMLSAMYPEETPKKPETREEIIKMAKVLSKLYDKPFIHYFEKLKKKYGIEETTTDAGSYTGPFLGSVAKAPEDPNKLDVSVVGEVTAGSGSVGAYDANALPNITRDGKFKSNPTTPKAFKKTQYPKGGFVKFNDCVKLNNKPAGAGCSQGAVDNVVKVVQTKGNINAPSLGEGNN